MLDRLRNGPWWVLAAFAGTLFFLGQLPVALLTAADARRPLLSLAISLGVALVASAAWGAVLAFFLVRLRRRFAPLLKGPDGEPLTTAQQRALARALTWGPLPSDPHARRSTAGLARLNLDMARQQRWFMVPVLAAFTALGTHLAVTESPWYWLAVLLFAGVLAYWFWTQRQMRRRLPLLEAPPQA